MHPRPPTDNDVHSIFYIARMRVSGMLLQMYCVIVFNVSVDRIHLEPHDLSNEMEKSAMLWLYM